MAAAESSPVLEDHDGFVEAFYHLLWVKNFNGEPCNVLVPDVVLYKYRIPAYWCVAPRGGSKRPAAGVPSAPRALIAPALTAAPPNSSRALAQVLYGQRRPAAPQEQVEHRQPEDLPALFCRRALR